LKFIDCHLSQYCRNEVTQLARNIRHGERKLNGGSHTHKEEKTFKRTIKEAKKRVKLLKTCDLKIGTFKYGSQEIMIKKQLAKAPFATEQNDESESLDGIGMQMTVALFEIEEH
jgi:hypothetical protein